MSDYEANPYLPHFETVEEREFEGMEASQRGRHKEGGRQVLASRVTKKWREYDVAEADGGWWVRSREIEKTDVRKKVGGSTSKREGEWEWTGKLIGFSQTENGPIRWPGEEGDLIVYRPL